MRSNANAWRQTFLGAGTSGFGAALVAGICTFAASTPPPTTTVVTTAPGY